MADTTLTNIRINKLFMRLPKRSEGVSRKVLASTFVDLDPLLTLLSTKDHQIIYGRRGTGKTHALLYLTESFTAKRDITLYVDMRTIGSSGGLYGDSSIPIAERGTRLLVDTLESIHESLLSIATDLHSPFDLSRLGPCLDALAEAITQVQVLGTVEIAETIDKEHDSKEEEKMGLSFGNKGLSFDISNNNSTGAKLKTGSRAVQKGTLRHRVHFGSLVNALTAIVAEVKKSHIWIFLDEWSAVPLDLQPLLADLIRRSILPVRGITIKIGAIEQRSIFQESREHGDYLGIELGADVSADVNLDDFMVFDNSAERAKLFFSNLLHRHVSALAVEDADPLPPLTSTQLTSIAFTRQDVYEEYVRACEGVPRDAINILSLAARKALTSGISMEHVRVAARTWYEQDKQAVVDSNKEAKNLLISIIDEVIGHRKTRAFLLRSNTRNEIIDDLFDKRVLHVLKRNISSNVEAGVRYDVFKMDYGCYVDLLATAKAPKGLLPIDGDEAAYIEVPPDDYRAIRRAILDLDELAKPKLTPF